MQPFRRGAALLASLSVLALTGCHHSDTDDNGHPALNGTNAVATVNGQDISQQQFFTQLQNYVAPPQNPQTPAPAGRRPGRPAPDGQLHFWWSNTPRTKASAPTDADVNALYSAFQTAQEAQQCQALR